MDTHATIVTTYAPRQRQQTGFAASLRLFAVNVWRSRELIWQMFRRDFLAAYRKSFLGLAWLFIAPVFSVLSWIFMNAAGVLRPGDVGMPYPAYVLLGTVIWGLFVGLYQATADTLVVGQSFILQVKYPHEAMLVKQIMQQLATFAINFTIILVALALFGVLPSWQSLFLPVAVLPLVLLASAIGLFVSMVGVVAPEVRKGTDLLMSVLVIVTPIIYSASAMTGRLATVVRWNPLTYVVAGVRDVVAYGRLDRPEAFLWCALGALVAFVVSWRLFYLAEDRVIEKMV